MVAEPGPDMRIRALTSGSTVLNRKPSSPDAQHPPALPHGVPATPRPPRAACAARERAPTRSHCERAAGGRPAGAGRRAVMARVPIAAVGVCFGRAAEVKITAWAQGRRCGLVCHC
jgi:hypothetical protein